MWRRFLSEILRLRNIEAQRPPRPERWSQLPDDEVVGADNSRGRIAFADGGRLHSRRDQLFVNLGQNSVLDLRGYAPVAEVLAQPAHGGGMGAVERVVFSSSNGSARPDPVALRAQGNRYLAAHFPNLSYVARTVHCGELAVRHARFQPLRSILAEIYLCHTVLATQYYRGRKRLEQAIRAWPGVGLCQPPNAVPIRGCMDSAALNFLPEATIPDLEHLCRYPPAAPSPPPLDARAPEQLGSFVAAGLAEIYLCDVCSCPEILTAAAPGHPRQHWQQQLRVEALRHSRRHRHTRWLVRRLPGALNQGYRTRP
jgi:hypothetical protein